MTPATTLSVAAIVLLYVAVALCAAYAWTNREWWLAVPLTFIFAVATVAVVWSFDRWGT